MAPRPEAHRTGVKSPSTASSWAGGPAGSPLDAMGMKSFERNGVDLADGHRITKRSLIAAIPDYCFTRPVLKSYFFIARDALFAAITAGVTAKVLLPTAYALSAVLPPALAWVFPTLVWVAYAVAQGTVLTGLWVIGHECGHQSFSPWTVVNDATGFVIHTALLVPYWSWKLSHAKHHKYTNHTTSGETHVPNLATEVVGFRKLASSLGEDAFSALNVFQHLVFGWPAYLVANATGGRETYDKVPLTEAKAGCLSMTHFVGSGSQLYEPKFHMKIWASGAGVIAMIGGLVKAAQTYGAAPVLLWYVAPYTVVNMWLVLYTWLQHCHEDIPHLGEDSFTWIRGALSTVDRPYPWLVDQLHHHIGTTHVLHHLFSRIPHYHAEAASKAMQAELREAYRYDPTPIVVATFQTATKCIFIDDTDGVQYFKDASGCASRVHVE